MTEYANRYDPPLYGPETEPEDEVKYSKQQAALLEVLRRGFKGSAEDFRIEAGLPVGTRTDSRLRDLRKPKFGAWPVNCARNSDTGHYEYWLTAPRLALVINRAVYREGQRADLHTERDVLCGDCGPHRSFGDSCPQCGGYAQPLPNKTF